MKHKPSAARCLFAALALVAVPALAQEPAPNAPANPGQAPTAVPKPSPSTEVLQKALAAYAKAKTYQGAWTYVIERAGKTHKMAVELKSKGATRLLFRISTPTGQKPDESGEAPPEMLALLDGKTAWFEHAGEKVFYKVALPKDVKDTNISPLMFFPQIPAASPVVLEPNKTVDGRTVLVLKAETTTGGTTRMEIDAETYHIRRIVSEVPLGAAKMVSTLAMDKETFDAELADSAFNFKPRREFREIAAPLDAAAIFGQPR
jgi:outer membrane lipoprotein-sorting protein